MAQSVYRIDMGCTVQGSNASGVRFSAPSRPTARCHTASCTMGTGKFDVHRAVHRNISSAAELTRCTKVSNLFHSGTTLYISVFQTVVRGPQVVLGFCPCGPLRLNISPKKTEK